MLVCSNMKAFCHQPGMVILRRLHVHTWLLSNNLRSLLGSLLGVAKVMELCGPNCNKRWAVVAIPYPSGIEKVKIHS